MISASPAVIQLRLASSAGGIRSKANEERQHQDQDLGRIARSSRDRSYCEHKHLQQAQNVIDARLTIGTADGNADPDQDGGEDTKATLSSTNVVHVVESIRASEDSPMMRMI
jgi:hypothetical protein